MQAPPGAILHIDYTLTSSYPSGERFSSWQESWQQQQGALCNFLTVEHDSPGTPPGTESGTIDGREELYDPVRNTIYVVPAAVSDGPTPPGGTEPGSECSFMARFADRVRGLLTSGQARVAGRATVDGKETIEIVSGTNTYYIAADGSYAPVELINGTPTDKAGMTTFAFRVYEQLPAADTGDLLSLTARYPNAQVDNSLADFRVANQQAVPRRLDADSALRLKGDGHRFGDTKPDARSGAKRAGLSRPMWSQPPGLIRITGQMNPHRCSDMRLLHRDFGWFYDRERSAAPAYVGRHVGQPDVRVDIVAERLARALSDSLRGGGAQRAVSGDG